MLEAGKNMCFEAPKEERKIFSTIDAAACQVYKKNVVITNTYIQHKH